MKLLPHPAADAFPMMDDKRFSELVDDIQKNGLRLPVVISDGKILDGRNRAKACAKLGIEPETKIYDGDPWAYVWSLNGSRRDLVAEQRYLIWKHCNENSETWLAARRVIQEQANKARSTAAKGNDNASKGRENSACTDCTHTVSNTPERKSKAALSKTNMGAVARGDALASNRPDLSEKVRKGEMKPAEAHQQMKRDKVKELIRAREKEDKPLTQQTPNLVLADPPWQYDFAETESRAIENQYPTATVEEIIKHRPTTEKDCVLLLWGTVAKLQEAMAVMAGWGFTYKTHAVWDKQKIGMGYWFRGQHELLLVGTKGKVSPPDSKDRVSSVFSEPRGQHSKKPECVYKWIESAFPLAIKLEMYCRNPRPGWQAWGNMV